MKAPAVLAAAGLAALAIAWSCAHGGAPAPVAAVPADAGMTTAAKPAPPPGPRWLKGNTHTHTGVSGDSQTDPDDVVRWYSEHGYDFVVFTDHNMVTTHPSSDQLLVLPGVELTHNPAHCQPPPPEPNGKCRIHVNALFVREHPTEKLVWQDDKVVDRVGKYQLAFDEARRLGGLIQVNHPNWHWGVNGELLTELARRGAVLVEIANQAFVTWNVGRPGKYPSTEEVWDQALTAGAHIWGVASDDAHNYYDVPFQREHGYGYGYPPGYGYVMVWARKQPEAIREAMEAGRFYASTGVQLERAEVDDGKLVVEVAPGGFAPYTIVFIGKGGAELARHEAADSAAYPLVDDGYVRAVVIDEYGQRAWVQPHWKN